MTNDKLLTALATVLVALPGTASLVPNLDLTPLGQFILLALALLGAAVLKHQPGAEMSAEDVRRIAAERERIRMGLARQEAERKASQRG